MYVIEWIPYDTQKDYPSSTYQLKEAETGKILLEDPDKMKLEMIVKMMDYAYLSGKVEQLLTVAKSKQEDIVSCL